MTPQHKWALFIEYFVFVVLCFHIFTFHMEPELKVISSLNICCSQIKSHTLITFHDRHECHLITFTSFYDIFEGRQMLSNMTL